MRLLFSFLFLCSTGISLSAQTLKTVALKPQHLGYATTGYYVNNVVDDRTEKNNVGKANNSGKIDMLNLQGGAAAALNDYITKNVTQARTKQAIIVHITRLNFEMKKMNGSWSADADIALTFYAGDIKLIELSAKGQKQGDDDPAVYVDEFIKRMLESNLKKFDTWWAQNANKVPVATTVKVIAKIGTKVNKPNCIVYSSSRPLRIADFEAKVEDNVPELAATLSGIGLETAAVTENGQIVVTLWLTPYFSKSGSWFRQEGKNERVLAHEQTHFDITAIKACELIQKVKNTTFNRDDYETQLQAMMNANTEETNKEEERFDTETDHGRSEQKEKEWEAKVKQRLKALGCYN